MPKLMTVHALRLPHVDYLTGVNTTNHVSAIANQSVTLVRRDTADSVTWFYQQLDGSALDVVATPEDLQLKIADVLEQAKASGDLLRLTLQGDRHLVVPIHHWPVFQVVMI